MRGCFAEVKMKVKVSVQVRLWDRIAHGTESTTDFKV